MTTWVLDFETASQLDVTVVGAWRYAQHPSTRPLMLAYAPADGDAEPKVWFPGQPFPGELLNHGSQYIAHNLEFELAIWNETLKPGVILRPEDCHCTMAQARYSGLPGSLDGAGKAMRLKHLKHSAAGQRLISFFCHIQPDGTCRRPEDHPTKWAEFVAYCVGDVQAERELWHLLPKLPPDERAVWIVHTRINMRGIACDLQHVHMLQALCKAAEQELQQGELGWFLSRPTMLRLWLSVLGCEVPDCLQDTLEAALHDAPPAARELIERRLAFAKSSTKKYKKMQLIAGPDDRLRGLHVFFGGHTGRFSGTLLQAQNIVRACVRDIPWNILLLETLARLPTTRAIEHLGGPGYALAWGSAMIRPMLQASPGRQLVAADFKAIEARVLAWLTGAERMLGLYHTGADPYRDMAAFIFGVAYEQVSDHQRWVGKQVILGCGYGMGWLKFMLRCSVEGVDIAPELAKLAVTTYRESITEIPEGWRALDEAISWAMEPEHWNRGRYLFGGRLIVWAVSHGQTVVSLGIRLPDGTQLRYKYPRFVTIPSRDPERGDERVFSYLSAQKQSTDPGPAWIIRERCRELREKHKVELDPRPYLAALGTPELDGFRRLTAWGGKIIENIVQKISRNLLTGAMLRVEPEFPIVLHVHDEIVCEVDNEAQEERVKWLMSQVPETYKGCPIEVETTIGSRYHKK